MFVLLLLFAYFDTLLISYPQRH